MKTNLSSLLIGLALLAGIHKTAAQTAQFFRIAGPTVTTITAFNAAGTIVWSGARPQSTYTVQTANSLAGGTIWVDYVQLPVTNSVNTNLLVSFNPPTGMALVPAGTFTIGDTLDGDSDVVPANVYVSSFYMDTNLVSLTQWQGDYNYATNNGYSFDDVGAGKAANYPVETVDWYDCVKWCNARSQQAGLTPVYYTDAPMTQIYTNGDTDTVYPNWGANGYRLPTEAEWEKAARGGLNGQRFPWGDTISWSQANYAGFPQSVNQYGYAYDLATAWDYDPAFSNGDNTGTLPYTSPVGYFAPNGYELYDMAGNVHEWCWDWYVGPPYPTGSAYLGGTNPTGAAGGPGVEYRVSRGGAWGQDARNARCANRDGESPGVPGAYSYGFRCVRGL